ncbi:UNVERIFIED_CONTAM: hypothetical protein FKN15_020314 [Acipenser sinensis]
MCSSKLFDQFLTQLSRTEGSVGVLRSHGSASFHVYTQELESGCRAKASPVGVRLSSLGTWPVLPT